MDVKWGDIDELVSDDAKDVKKEAEEAATEAEAAKELAAALQTTAPAAKSEEGSEESKVSSAPAPAGKVDVFLPPDMEGLMSAHEWSDLPLNANITKALYEVMEFGRPSRIQADVLPYVSKGYVNTPLL
jgi:hypothetical protein